MLVSVIIPTYNRAEWLREAVDSVLAQSSPDLEIIVVDDGSTDYTQEMMAGYSSQLRYYRQENQGVGAARNYGMTLAKGEYIAFLDSDDLWLPFKIELQVKILNRFPEIGYLFTEFHIFRDSDTMQSKGLASWFEVGPDWSRHFPETVVLPAAELGVTIPDGNVRLYKGDMYRQALYHPYALPTTLIVRRSCLTPEMVFGEKVLFFEDWEFIARISAGSEAGFLDLETAKNRSHNKPGRVTMTSRLNKIVARLEMMERVWKQDPAFMEQHGDEYRRLEARELVECAEHALLEPRSDLVAWSLDRRKAMGLNHGNIYAAWLKILSCVPAGSILHRLIWKVETLVRHLFSLPGRREFESV